MPSPVGHALGGLCGGWAVGGRGEHSVWTRQAAILGVAGMLPDVDLLFGMHSGPTHSVGAAAIVVVLAWVVAQWKPTALQRLAPAAIGLAYASHILLDWLGEDTSAPHGVMALWPFSLDHFISPVALMPSITRRYWLPGFWEQNARALLFEVAVLLPLAGVLWWTRRARPHA